MKVALAQIAPVLGDLQHNSEIHLECIDRAHREGIHLLVFPELSLTGYFLRDQVAAVALPVQDRKFLKPICQSSHGLDVVLGFVEQDERHRFYIASAYISGGEIIHVHRKVYLPTYGIYEDARFFAPGDTFNAFETANGWVGLLICEDAWHMSSAYLEWMGGADILLIVNAMPVYGLAEEEELRSQTLPTPSFVQTYAQLLTCVVAYCNRVGVEDGVTFGGGSVIVSPACQVLSQGPPLEEAWVAAEVDLDEIRRARQRLPFLRDERMDLTFRELDRIRQTGRRSSS